SGGIDGWAEGDDLNSPAEIGGTGRGVISVGAYVTRNEFDTENVGHVGTGETMGGIASFSSHGPTADGRVKPDVAAPGSAVVSSASSHDATLSSQPVALYQQYGGLDYAYAYMQGTSMAAPVVTGTVAQWLEACPGLSPADVRRIIASTSVSDSYTGDVGPGGDCTWGFGKLDAMAGMQAVLDFASGLPGVAAVPSTVAVCPLGGGRVRIVAPAGSAVSVAVSRADGVSVMSADGVSPGHVADLSALPSGVYVVRASAAAGTACAKVAVR
ncbi:MAG: S8 family serine peptidase, partial [Prevotella sp.]|nr:S8 family serine peptidase [Prevotella sp.]